MSRFTILKLLILNSILLVAPTTKGEELNLYGWTVVEHAEKTVLTNKTFSASIPSTETNERSVSAKIMKDLEVVCGADATPKVTPVFDPSRRHPVKDKENRIFKVICVEKGSVEGIVMTITLLDGLSCTEVPGMNLGTSNIDQVKKESNGIESCETDGWIKIKQNDQIVFFGDTGRSLCEKIKTELGWSDELSKKRRLAALRSHSTSILLPDSDKSVPVIEYRSHLSHYLSGRLSCDPKYASVVNSNIKREADEQKSEAVETKHTLDDLASKFKKLGIHDDIKNYCNMLVKNASDMYADIKSCPDFQNSICLTNLEKRDKEAQRENTVLREQSVAKGETFTRSSVRRVLRRRPREFSRTVHKGNCRKI